MFITIKKKVFHVNGDPQGFCSHNRHRASDCL